MAIVMTALLGAWFATGWHDVRAREVAIEDAPVVAASAKAGELARELRNELDRLVEKEAARPYFQYQNLFHDPRAGGEGVTPSPLASGPENPLVLGYFQIDGKGHVSTPSLNEQFPQLSETQHLFEHEAFRDAVAMQLAAKLAPPRDELVAVNAPPRQIQSHVAAAHVATENAIQTFQIDPNAYAQNTNANAVYGHQAGIEPSFAGRDGGAVLIETPTHDTQEPHIAAAHVETVEAPKPKPVEKPKPVTITVSSLAWHTLPFSGGDSLVATRDVQTPDGNLAQGFVVDRAALTSWLANHAGALVAKLQATTATTAAEIVPGWELTVEPNPRDATSSIEEAASVVTAFLIRFAIIGALAVCAAILIVWLVARAERYARERSQFAAAAAHELRTPLAGLQLYGDMLADGLGDPAKLRDYARRMSEEASRLGRVVSNVLGFSQLERGNLSIDPQRGNIAAALRELAEHVQPTFDRAGAVIDLDVPETLEARFDRDALARIIGNLLDNAEKYTRDADDRTIHLRAKLVAGFAEISVHDHGVGVANPQKLFQAFARGVSTDGPAGLGLGLALSRSLAQAMGGELSYRDGDGATFVLRLGVNASTGVAKHNAAPPAA
jgi:signal transduction histidine kinase